jgi:hypothetical protein
MRTRRARGRDTYAQDGGAAASRGRLDESSTDCDALSRSSVKTAAHARQRAHGLQPPHRHRRGLPAWEPPRRFDADPRRCVLRFLGRALARRSGHLTDEGARADGICDVVTCGIAPAVLLASAASTRPSAVDRLAPGVYVAAIAWRVVKYGFPPRTSHVFTGMPVTGAGVTMAIGLRLPLAPRARTYLALGVVAMMLTASHLVGRGHHPARTALHRPRGGASVRVGRGGCGRAPVRVRRASP